ncbi:hypothetical protein K1719_030515 [Acacia pycnantha]|nr:hypothetical protein K1719_030515 [Acacia pycnantha]
MSCRIGFPSRHRVKNGSGYFRNNENAPGTFSDVNERLNVPFQGFLIELGTDVNLYALVFGESVLNYAIAISLYRTMSSVKSNHSGNNFIMVVVRFLETFVGSISSGVGVGFTSALLFKYAGLDIDNLQNLESCLLFFSRISRTCLQKVLAYLVLCLYCLWE